MSSNQPIVFLSYSHKDEALKERLETHLKAMRGRLEVWEDRLLKAGEDWFAGITQALDSAHAAVLLISADFLASDFIQTEEVPRLLKRREKEGVAIIPVLISSCPWQEIPWLAALQIRPADARPIAAFEGNDREQVFADIASEVLGLATEQMQRTAKSMPRPNFIDASSKELAEALESAYLRHEEQVSRGGDASETLSTILDLKRRLREGGTLKPGDLLGEGRYNLLEVLGRGGFSTVFKAYDRESLGLVAVKVLRSQFAEDKTKRERFFRGARKMAELRHPAIVGVIEPEAEDGGYHYFTMEYVEGGDLRKAVASGQISGLDGLSVLGDVAEALDLAHQKGMIHRDVKPANILLTRDGKAKLTDFDLVRAFDTTAGTRTGSMLGTFLYMAPEAMMAAENATAAADVYSLAMCAAFVLHGAEIPPTFMRQPEAFFDELETPEGIKRVLLRATAWEMEERPGSSLELWRELERWEAPPFRRKRRFSERASASGSELLQAPVRPGSGELVSHPDSVGTWASRSGEDKYGKWASFQGGGVVQRMRWIPPGTFTMGSPESELGRFDREGPAHRVTLTKGFWLADTPCTQALWQAVMGDNPSRTKSPEHPVEKVSWNDCQQFFEKLKSLAPGLAFLRLPTEAEWEYACRAGSSTATWAGDLDSEYRSAILDPIAWYTGNRDRQTQPVAGKEANPWGLYDMLGNVREWCLDGLRTYSEDPETDPVGLMGGTSRVIRGGSWSDSARSVRAACRNGDGPSNRVSYLGFRLCRGPVRGAP